MKVITKEELEQMPVNTLFAPRMSNVNDVWIITQQATRTCPILCRPFFWSEYPPAPFQPDKTERVTALELYDINESIGKLMLTPEQFNLENHD